MPNLKYKLVKTGILPCFYDSLAWDGDHIPIYRLKALRDIPEYGVFKGDLGGYVSSKLNLSQEGSCWISGDAKVLGNVSISEDAFIGDIAMVICNQPGHFIDISGKASIRNSSIVSFDKSISSVSDSDTSIITGNVRIGGRSRVTNVDFIEGSINIRDYASIVGAREITGEVNIFGRAYIERNATIGGRTFISDDAIVEYGATVVDSILLNDAQVYAEETAEGKSLGGYPKFLQEAGEKLKAGLIEDPSPYAIRQNKNLLFSIEADLRFKDEPILNLMDFSIVTKFLNEIAEANELKAKNLPYDSIVSIAGTAGTGATTIDDVRTSDALNLLLEIKNDLHEYESDIVKILQYPAMTDNSDPLTLDMVAALKLANRLALNPSHTDFIGSVFDLEKKFLTAESNARRIASTRLAEGEQKNTDRARDLIAIAADEASTEHEKKIAFKQAFKQLEGIIAVPDVAVDTFRVKIGLKELETLR